MSNADTGGTTSGGTLKIDLTNYALKKDTASKEAVSYVSIDTYDDNIELD